MGTARTLPWIVLLLTVWSCAGIPGTPGTPPAPTPVPADVPEPADEPDPTPTPRPVVADYEVPVPDVFAAAVARGTRTLTGRPGPSYWRQHMDYRIEAELDPAAALIRGVATITFTNRAPEALPYIGLHLYQNLFREGAVGNERVPRTGGISLQRVALNGRELADGTGYRVDGTRMRVLSRVAPGERVELALDWQFAVPPAGAPRMGHVGTELFEIAQWYPQVAVYDDLHGWHEGAYRGRGEFYLEYGDFDVSIAVPEGYVIAATGLLENPEEVLGESVLERYEAAWRADSPTAIVSEADLGVMAGATREAPGGLLTWRYRARDVRDFAFAASNRYLWDGYVVEVPDRDGDGQAEQVGIHAFRRPEAATWRDAAAITGRSIRDHSRLWYPYLYPQMTAAEGPEGGMEYPMLTFVGPFPSVALVAEVINHEVAHMWMPMMVGADEAAYPWMDEGLATYMEHESPVGDGPARMRNELNAYRTIAAGGLEEPLTVHADAFRSGGGYAVAAYYKPGLALRALEAVIGRDAVHAAIGEYVDRWLLRHPAPLDFFNTVESVAGEDLDWFWHHWWYTTDVLDQAIAGVTVDAEGGGEVEIVVENQGGIPMPVEIAVELASGEIVELEIPVEVWLAGEREHVATVTVSEPVVRVRLDPRELLPDMDPTDDVWEPEAEPERR